MNQEEEIRKGGEERRRFKKWDAVMYEGEPYIVESDEEEDGAVKLAAADGGGGGA